MHRQLQAWAGAPRGSSELVQDPAKDHQGHLPVVGRIGARERGSSEPEARCDEIDEDLPKGLLFFAGGGRERGVQHQGMEFRAPSVEVDADINQLMDGFCKAQGSFGVDRPFRFGHFARVVRGEFTGDGLLIGEKLVKGGRRHVRFRGDRVCGGFVVAKAAEDCGCGAEELLPALLPSRVALAVGIEDGHRPILAEGRDPSKNLDLLT